MALKDIIKTSNKKKDGDPESLEEHIVENIEEYRNLIAYGRIYPDKLVDYYLSLGNPYNFRFRAYQRLFLRALFRHRYLYGTFVRAGSKSFMSVMGLMLKCVLYPGATIGTAAGGKEQSAQIVSSKVSEICKLIPAMSKEIIGDTRGMAARTSQTKDSVTYAFVNGSILRNIAANENSRGSRLQSLLVEECVGVDQDVYNEVLKPTLNVDRQVQGTSDPREQLNKSEIYVTTAGYKNTVGYEKLIQTFCQSVARPDEAIVLGGSGRVPMMEGLFDKDFIRTLKMDGTYNEASFEREYKYLYSLNIVNCWKALRAT